MRSWRGEREASDVRRRDPDRAVRGWACAVLPLVLLGAAPDLGGPAAAHGISALWASQHDEAPHDEAPHEDASRARVAAAPPIPVLGHSPWPELAAVFPGALIHGSGTWLQGRTLTTQRLLLLEGASLLAIVVGGLVIYETGAARDLAGPATFSIAAGVGTLGSSFLANLYATWSPADGRGWGAPRRRLPMLVSSLGYTFVDDAQFAEHHFLTARLDGRLGAWHVEAGAALPTSAGREQLSAQVGYRVLGPRAAHESAPDGSYLEPRLGVSSQRFDRYGFVTRTTQVELEGRLDVERLLPDVRGAFFQAAAGLARQWIAFDAPGVDTTDIANMLLVHSGFGLYLGARCAEPAPACAAAQGGELELYYDHRRDTFAGGMKTSGPTSGFAGHVGLAGEYYVSASWGVSGLVELGSAWVLGSSVRFRTGMP